MSGVKIVSCSDIEEVRGNIDRIDARIIELISERGCYVKQASKFKKDEDAVKAPYRVESVIAKVRSMSADAGLDPDIAEKVYRSMISAFIEFELKEYRNRV